MRPDPAHLGPRWPIERRPLAAATKLLLDLALSLALGFILLVPLTIVALLIKLTSRGPVLYRQERIGLHGRPFKIYKFRTMRLDAEARTGPIWASHNDPRCTALGRLLRRLSVDELPQLLNVLRGEMSLVGPRPERPFFVETFARELPHYHERHAMRPGVTGWAQIHGWRGDTSIEKRLECDLHYVRHWNLKLDLLVLVRTPWELVGGRNAY
jgi:exopolysaccharide biosynthesis polyprenyl glycosylphosphotransferase